MAICEWCKNEIPKEKKSNMFCDLKCYREWNASFKPKLVCEICQKVYSRSLQRSKISTCCSKECRAQKAGKFAKIAHLGKSDVELVCLNCDKHFVLPQCKTKTRKYCCKACQLDHWKRSKQYINCIVCGIRKEIKPYQTATAKYCSQKCKAEDLKNKTGILHPSYKHGFRTYRKRALEYYNYTCKSCGLVDRRLHVHHLDGNNKNNIPTNWMILCPLCHRRVHLGKIPLPQDL